MRILLRDLSPATTYQIQLRANDGSSVSEWSRIFALTTTGDTVAPNTPTGVSGSMSGTTFTLSWSAVTTSTDGTPAHDLDHYEVKVESGGTGTNAVYVVKDTKFTFDLDQNRQLFGSPRANIIMSVRSVDTVGNASSFSSQVNQTNAAPAAVTGLTTATGVDTVTLRWTGVADTDLQSYEVHLSTTGSAGSYSKIWEGLATSYTHQTTNYFVDHWYRVYAKDVFGTLSSATQTGAAVRPVSPFAFDTTAPAVPTGLAATLTTTSGPDIYTSAAVSWTAVTDTDGDLAGYQIGYRPVGASDWQYATADYTVTSTRIDRLAPYVNYEFRIRSFDFSANYSSWSSTVTTTTAATNTAPAAPTGLVGAAGASTVTVLWTENTETDVKNGAGMYEVQMDTVNTFNSGNLQTIKTAATVASFRTDGLAAGNRYIRVRAVDSLGLAGSYSSTLTVNQADLIATQAYTQSRGMNLVTNGSGALGNNTNFSTLTFDASDRPFGGGSFYTTTQQTSKFNDENMSVDTAKTYVLTGYARSRVAGNTTSKMYMGIAMFDVDNLSISANMHMYRPNTLTTLAADLNPGATTVTLTSAANWQNAAGAGNYERTFIFWNYVDGKGYAWPANTYSRNVYGSAATEMWAPGAISGNVITLDVPWAGAAIPAGTQVSNGTAGGTYKYIAAVNVNVPETWTKYQGSIGGVDLTGTNQTSMFSPGTSYARILLLANYTGSPAGSIQGFGGFSFSEVAGQNLLSNSTQGDVIIANTLAGDRVIANTLDANVLKANTSIIQNLNVKSTLTLGDASTDGSVQSYGYVAGTTGFKLAKSGLEINQGVIKAAALQLQNSTNLMPHPYASFEMTDKYFTNPFWDVRGQTGMLDVNSIIDGVYTTNPTEVVKGNRYLAISQPFNNSASAAYFGTSTTDYNINVEANKTYIFSIYTRNRAAAGETWNVNVKGDNGAQIATQAFALPANESVYTRRSFAFTVPASGVNKILIWLEKPGTTQPTNLWVDCAQLEEKTGTDNTPSVWSPPGVTELNGSGISTGSIRSNQTLTVGGSVYPVWSINTQGNAIFGDALIRGKLIVGSTTEKYPNRAPNNGDFETDVSGYSIYHVGATTPALARTTTGGEVIAGTGSAKASAAAGAKTSLGMSFVTAMQYPAGTILNITFDIKTDNAAGDFAIAFEDSGATVYETRATLLGNTPVAGTVYSFVVPHVVPAGTSLNKIYIYQTGSITATSVIMDSLVLTANNEIGPSYIQSPNFQSGDGGSGWRIDGNGDVEFNSGFFRGQLGAGIVTADTMASTITISSIFRTGETGQRVQFSQDGITAFKPDNTMAVNIPTDGISASSFDGDLLASSLTISDQLAIRGSNNELSKGATITLAGSTTSPSSPPTVTVDWKTITMGGNDGYAQYRWGITQQGGYWRVPIANYGVGCVVESYDITTGAKQWGTLQCTQIWFPNSITSIGNNVYILGTDRSGAWRLCGYTFTTAISGTPTLLFNVAYQKNSDHYVPALGTDGTNILVTYTSNINNIVGYYTHNASTGARIGSFTTSADLRLAGDMAYIGKSTFDNGFGATTVFVVANRNYTNAYVLNSSFARVSKYDFPLIAKPAGMAFASNKFYTFDAAGYRLAEHTSFGWDSTISGSGTWHAVSTWYDSSILPLSTVNVSNKALTSNVATLTTATDHGLTTSDSVTVAGVDATFNGIYTVASTPTTTTFTYAKTAANVTSQAATGTAGKTGTTHQTSMGPIKSFTMKQRARVTVTVPPIPIRPVPNTNDDAVAAGVYMARNGTAPIRQKFERQLFMADGVRTVVFDTSNPTNLPAVGADATNAPPVTSDFPDSAPALIRSANDKINLGGDGTIVLGDLTLPSGQTYVKAQARQYNLTMATGWATYGSPYGTPRAYRTMDGAWVLTGLVKRTGANATISGSGTTVATVPSSAYACAIQQISPTLATSNASNVLCLQMDTTGNVLLRVAVGASVTFATNEWFNLSGITFHEAAN